MLKHDAYSEMNDCPRPTFLSYVLDLLPAAERELNGVLANLKKESYRGRFFLLTSQMEKLCAKKDHMKVLSDAAELFPDSAEVSEYAGRMALTEREINNYVFATVH